MLYYRTEAKELCTEMKCKYIAVSAVLNHRVDELLVGIATQVRLNVKRQEDISQGVHEEQLPGSTTATLFCTPLTFLKRLFMGQKETCKPCEDLTSL